MRNEQSDRIEKLGFDLSHSDDTGETLADKFDSLDINIDDFNDAQIIRIASGLNELTPEDVSVYAHSNFDDTQMYNILQGLLNDEVQREVVELYAKPELDSIHMNLILNGSRDFHLSFEELSVLTDPNSKGFQLENAMAVLREGFGAASGAAVADPDLTAVESYSMRLGIENGLTLESLKDELRLGEDKLDSFIIGDTTINEISVWDVSKNFEISDVDHLHDSDYFVSTDNGDFEIHVEIFGNSAPNPYTSTIFYKIESDNDDSNNGKYIRICCDINAQLSAYDMVKDAVESDYVADYVDVDKHSIEIEKSPCGDNEDGNAQFRYIYSIDGNEIIEDTQYDNNTFDSISRLCETDIDAVGAKLEQGDKFDSLDDFRKSVEAESELSDFEGDDSSENNDDFSQDSEQEEQDVSVTEDINIESLFDFTEIIHESIMDYKELDANNKDDTDNDAQNKDTEQHNDVSVDSEDRQDNAEIDDSDDINDDYWDAGDSGDSVD